MPRVEAPTLSLVLAGAVLTASLAAACGAQTTPLPACEWCGTAEAPDSLASTVTIAGEAEPGERLVIEGVVYEPDGETPADDVILYLYHTNAEGVYPKRGDEKGNARRHGYLRGWLRTGADGRYEVRTIRPGNYPGRDAAQHIHVTVQEPDGTPEYWIPSFKFADDPLLDADPGAPNVVRPERGSDGVWRAERDIVLPPREDDLTALCVDTARSRVAWRGTERVGSGHAGTVDLAHGRLRLRDGAVVGGAFTVDMQTIAITDIPAREVEARRTLRRHLAHEEFFGVDRFPTARLVLTDVVPLGAAAYRVTGDLAIRDSVHAVTFHAAAPVVTDTLVRATAALDFDRYRWGIDFDGLTSALRNALVDPMIQLRLRLVATGATCADIASGGNTPSPPSDTGTRRVNGGGSSGADLPAASGATGPGIR
ncbi:MAG: YceI family protein [Longimicrobiales bacterium]|nr:YceI family protein [Longimicrobiales bacterium]